MGDTLGTIGRIGAGITSFGTSELANEALGGQLFDPRSGVPGAPDFVGAAREQSQLSHVNQQNPFMTSNWVQGPDGRWTQNVGLSGGLGQAAQGLQGQVAGLSRPMDWSQFGPAMTGDQARDQAITAAYNQASSRLDPQWQQRESQLTSRLANQGLSPMDEAGRSALQEFGRNRNDAYTSAMASAIGQGTEAGNAAFRNNLLARQTSIADALRQRQQPLSELQQLRGFTAGAQSPGTATGPNLLGGMNAAYQGALDTYSADQAAKNSQLSGLAGLGRLAAVGL